MLRPLTPYLSRLAILLCLLTALPLLGVVWAQAPPTDEFLPYYLPGSREALPRVNLTPGFGFGNQNSTPRTDPLTFRAPNPHSADLNPPGTSFGGAAVPTGNGFSFNGGGGGGF